MPNWKALMTTLVVAGTAIPNMASAQEHQVAFDFAGNVAMASDYRFRGVSLSDNSFAIQGGFDVSHASGLYAGTWASSIDTFNGAEAELDFYGGIGFSAGGLAVDVGGIAYLYPDADDSDYGEVYASVGGEIGNFGATIGVAYAPEQQNLGDEDNLYVFLDTSTGLATIAETSISLDTHVGYTDGVLTVDGELVDYAVGLSAEMNDVGLGVQWVGTDDDSGSDLFGDAAVFTISQSF